MLECFGVCYVNTCTKKFEKQGNSRSHAKCLHLTVYLTMCWACIDSMCHALITGYCKLDILMYNQCKDGTSGGKIVKCQTM